MKVYFTYGSHKVFPHKNGYMVVEGVDFSDAIGTYRKKYPDTHGHRLNCEAFYTEKEWEDTKCYENQEPKEVLVSELAKKFNRMVALLESAILLHTARYQDCYNTPEEFWEMYLGKLGSTREELSELGVEIEERSNGYADKTIQNNDE